MALPKRKFSKGRRDKRRANWKLTVRSTTKCPQCAGTVLPHRVCPRCGTYRGRQLVVVSQPKKGSEPS
jgi:large subunit ribosomal protein L32